MVAIELVFFDGTDRRFPVEEGCELLIGAAAAAAVRLTGGDVSRNHALLSRRKGRVVLLDLGSTNGTFVNGRRIKEAVIQAGDAIRFSSVTAQVVPKDGRGSGSDVPIPPRPGLIKTDKKTSDRLPAVWWGGRLGDLISRWAVGGESAVGVLAEWCVGVGGARGVAIIEGRDKEVAVLAADGEIAAALEAGASRALAGGGASGSGPESMVLEAAQQQVLAIRTPGRPCIFIALGQATPDATEINLMVKLLEVARRLDGSGEPIPAAAAAGPRKPGAALRTRRLPKPSGV